MLTGKQALVVEDDLHVCEVIKASLERENIQVSFCHDGLEAVTRVQQGSYDFIILDIMLPGLEGNEVCRQLRQAGYALPIIMLTAKVDEVDKILGLELGADDYLTKPFSPRELLARCKAAYRRFDRSQVVKTEEISLEDVVIRSEQYKALVNGIDLELTPKEFELFLLFARHPGQTFTRDHVLEQVWGFASASETRTVDEHIKRIRKKLRNANCKGLAFKTVWGVGYQLEVGRNG